MKKSEFHINKARKIESKLCNINLNSKDYIFASSKPRRKRGFLHFRWNKDRSPLRNEITCLTGILDNHNKIILTSAYEKQGGDL